MHRILIWFAIAVAGLAGCQPPLQMLSTPTQSAPTVSAPTVEPRPMPTPAPTSAPGSTATVKSGLTFIATVGPTCPGPQREGQVCTAPYEGEFIVTRPDGGEAARFKTDVDGRAVVDLPPGNYTVSTKLEAGSPLRRGGSVEVTVVTGQYVEVALDLDTGMR
jgi:hypothetical protein